MYAADRLLAHFGAAARVDILERLPTPYGLVRSGVAPDHAGTKSVTSRFDGILADPRVAFMGNVALGRDVSVDDLTPRYHALVLAYGAEGDKELGIPGEHTLKGVYSAREFVGWYNGDPACVEYLDGPIRQGLVGSSNADATTAVIFGLGNVALDCARMLLKQPQHLADTDICAHALDALTRSKIRRVVMVGRRGVAQAAFSPKELRELLSLPGVKVTVDPTDLALSPEDEEDLAAQRPRRRAFEAITNAIVAGPAATGEGGDDRELVLRFLRSPIELLPGAEAADVDGVATVGSVRLAVNALHGPSGARKAVSTGATETVLAISLVLKAVGYRALPIEASENACHSFVPFDDEQGVVPNRFGRVFEPSTGWQMPGWYVCGWLKRGPTGIIGTNLNCAEETVGALIEDSNKGLLRRPDYRFKGRGVRPLLETRGVTVVDADGWRRIDAAERAAGEAAGKLREKLVDVQEMLKVAAGGGGDVGDGVGNDGVITTASASASAPAMAAFMRPDLVKKEGSAPAPASASAAFVR